MLTSPENIAVQEVETPTIQRNEILVKIKYCGICTFEQRLFTGAMKLYYPIIPGHEASGEVIQVGEDVRSKIKPGTRVAVDLVNRCGECYFCRKGQSNMCLNRFKRGRGVMGGFGEYLAVKSTQAFPILDSLSYQEAALTEPVSCCIRSLKKIELSLAEDLLIMGAGSMGLIHLQTALCMGARVFVCDPDRNRLEKAMELGAYKSIDPACEDLTGIVKEHTEGRGVDVCVITTPAYEALGPAFEALSHTGRVNIYTSYNEKFNLPVDANNLHKTEKLVTGSEGRTEHDFLQAVRLLSFGKLNVKPLISSTTSFNGIEEGMRAAISRDTYRVLLDHEAD